MMEEEATACLKYEDTYGKLLRIELQCAVSMNRNKELKILKDRASQL